MTIKQLKSRPAQSYEVLIPEVVAAALHRLASRPIHPNFAGYLAVKRASRTLGKVTQIPCDFKEFFDSFLKVGEFTQKPYLMPFNESGKPTPQNIWFNKNVAGSYAPSSIRSQSAFAKVVDVERGTSGGQYSLRDNHPQLAFSQFLYANALSVTDLAIVLYRDYGFMGEGLSLGTLIEVFRDEFGFRSEVPNENVAYQILFSESTSFASDEKLFDTSVD